MQNNTNIYVYLEGQGITESKFIGILSAQQIKARKAFSFSYDTDWINSQQQLLIDPDIAWYSGKQYPNEKENFGLFFDSMPDNWGKMLMKRRAAILAKEKGEVAAILYDVDFLLGVHDLTRMGGLRFKKDKDGDFLDNDSTFPAPPWASTRELQYGAELLESNKDSVEVRKWLKLLMAPGSSLGGARPKANILDKEDNLWIAKFPSKNDTINKAAWEYLAYKLALNAGILMAESKIENISGQHHTFFTKRFDRKHQERIHFASAMTMTGKNEALLRDKMGSYLDIVEFIQFSGINVAQDMEQLWRRIIFNILISNTDDHLRNHGFLLSKEGWHLSPAYDINPSIDKDGLAINIDSTNNNLDLELAKTVGKYFRLDNKKMDKIISEVKNSVVNWKKIAKQIGIARGEQILMETAFKT